MKARATQTPHGYMVPNRPIGQIVANDGQLIHFTQADLKALVHMERDAGIDIRPEQVQFIKSLPNGAEVADYLAKNHADARMIGQTSTSRHSGR